MKKTFRSYIVVMDASIKSLIEDVNKYCRDFADWGARLVYLSQDVCQDPSNGIRMMWVAVIEQQVTVEDVE